MTKLRCAKSKDVILKIIVDEFQTAHKKAEAHPQNRDYMMMEEGIRQIMLKLKIYEEEE